MSETVYVLLGSNLGDRARYLRAARENMAKVEGLEITAVSAIYASQAQNMDGDTPPFLNQVIKADYRFSPGELLRALERIERDLDRTDKGKGLPRTIDLDILLFGDRALKTEGLNIPHPELLNRPFVLVPLLEIDPEATLPPDQVRIADWLRPEDRDKVFLFEDHVARQV
ncbi:MAG: 2-amino-4-hydroxy-6-hydroxymethyldihydropteridine diphosphokinase [Candidatus Zixiibacteriota bacterium]|nr:MAG: 2-amino-4-hydroxy-6-hydroxymethyldihydropteridine diphosphokinase [candidate division Zixibacteria bacterium]